MIFFQTLTKLDGNFIVQVGPDRSVFEDFDYACSMTRSCRQMLKLKLFPADDDFILFVGMASSLTDGSPGSA